MKVHGISIKPELTNRRISRSVGGGGYQDDLVTDHDRQHQVELR